MLMRALSVHVAHEIAGAARIRHSLRPLIGGGRENYLQTSGISCREIADAHSVSSSRMRGPSIPETSMIEPRGRGVLGHPVSRAFAEDDSFICQRIINVIASAEAIHLPRQ